MKYRFQPRGCAVAPSSQAPFASETGSGWAPCPPGSCTKAQLCRKLLQFPPSCVTSALLCLSAENHNHMGPGGILPRSTKNNIDNCTELQKTPSGRSANEPLLSSTCCVFIGTNEEQQHLYTHHIDFYYYMSKVNVLRV